MLRPAFLLGFVASSAVSFADIEYDIVARHGEPLHVTMTIPAKGTETAVQSPRWAPGSYRLANNARRILKLTATDVTGAALDLKVVDDMTWSVNNPQKGPVVLHYDVFAAEQDDAIHYSGPSTYLYVVGRKDEKCKLAIDIPADWKIAIGLDPDKGGAHRYVAENYDVFADTPVTMGDFILDTYEVDGKPHYIALRNPAKSQVDRAYLIKACKYISEMDDRLFHGLPYKRYVWHFAVNDRPDGAGGLEHLNGTEITLAKGLGPRAVGVLSHEYFHLWNVKRIRSKPLGPFDYTQLPQTGALWWLEGVTDYYAHTLLRRNGWSDDKQYFGTLSEQVRTTRSKPARMQVSPYDASDKVREAAGGVGNSQGYLISYYDTGWLVGLCLDLEILKQTNGKKSLDDVELALWKECRNNQPGFPEDEIRRQCVNVGAPSLGDFYDKIVLQAGELPVEEQLAKVGLQFVTRDEATIETGFTAGPQVGGTPGILVRVSTIPELHVDDLITTIGGVSLSGFRGPELAAAYQRGLATATVGQPLAITVSRDGKSADVSVTPVAGTRKVQEVVALPGADAATIALRKEWLSAKRG